MHPNVNGVAELLAGRYAAISAATAGSTAGGDAVEVQGAWIDRQGFDSLKVLIGYSATLASGKTLSLKANLNDSTASTGTGETLYGTAMTNTVMATGDSGGSTETGIVELDFDLHGAERYVQIEYTPDLNNTGTDVATLAAMYVLGGAQVQPVTAKVNTE